jgi:ketosteroid isomerase-like protein
MNRIVGALLLALACAAMTFAQAAAPAAPAKAPSTADTIKQLEHDWTDAVKAGDADKLGQILADDWVGLQYDGKKYTKEQVIANVKSGSNKIDSMDFGPMSVKVLGNVAVVQGSDTEKSTMNGKDTSGKWVWMDVFVKRNGNWVAVRSQSAMLK